MKKYKLEDYVKNIVNKSLQNKVVYDEPHRKYSEAVSKLISEAKREETNYGSLAERLADSGLTRSGYADYIDTRVKNKAKKSLESSLRKKEQMDKEIDLSNQTFAKEEAEHIQKIKNEVLLYADKNKVNEFNALFEYGINIGLSSNDAKQIAEEISEKAKQELRLKNIEKTRNTILSRRFTKAQAYEYAISLGLSQEDAEELGNFAYKMNQDPNSIFPSYKKPNMEITGGSKSHTPSKRN